MDGIFRQSSGAIAPGDFATNDGADHAVDVPDLNRARDLGTFLDRRLAHLHEHGVIERLVQAVILSDLAEATHFRAGIGLEKNLAEVESLGLPVIDRLAGFQPVRASDHFSNGAEPELSHEFADFLRDELHEVHRVRRVAGEVLAQLGGLGGHADRAGVQMADTHHDAAERDERCGGETEFLGAEHRRDNDVATGLQLSVRFDRDARAEIVQHERLMGFGEAELPRDARVLDGSLGRCTGAAVVTGDEDDIRVSLGDAGRDRADADFGDELDADARVDVRVLEVVDELREILNRVDVVVRRRRDEADTRRRVPCFRDPRIDFAAGQLSAFAGLRALSHLDLELLGIDEVEARDAETAARDLLDRGIL